MSAVSADAPLIALADEIMALHEETQLMSVAVDNLSFAERDRVYRDDIDPKVARQWALRAELASLRATTLAGFSAKARIIQAIGNCAPGFADPYNDDAMAWSLANDLLGVESVWALNDDEDTDKAGAAAVGAEIGFGS
jgi:hypothetical protein